MIQARIDRMEELEQMIIKTSAILGMAFSRRMLDTILPKKITQKMVQDCMHLIAESSIFCCDSLLDNTQVDLYNICLMFTCKEAWRGSSTYLTCCQRYNITDQKGGANLCFGQTYTSDKGVRGV